MDALPQEQIHCIAQAVHSETRGISDGPVQVALVILNRTESNLFPDTPCEVVFQKYQFTGLRKSSPVSEAALKATHEALILHKYSNKHILFFHNTSVKPRWTKYLTPIIKIGKHIFYEHTNEQRLPR